MADPKLLLNTDEDAVVDYSGGMTFIARKVPDAPKFTIAALIEAGAYDDVVSGTAHFFEHLPFGKTENFEDEKVFAYMLERGGNIGAYTTRDRTVFHGEVLKGSERDAILAVSDLICRPRLEAKWVQQERETILDEWAFGEMDAERFFYKSLTDAAYGPNVSLLPVIGTDETIMQIGLAEVQSFYDTNYVAERLIVAMEGDLDPYQAIDWAKEKFRLPHGAKRQTLARIDIASQTHILPTEQRATKTSVILQGKAINQSQKEMAANYFFGKMLFGVSGPLMKEMRFGKRLVYDVRKSTSDCQTNYAFDAITFDAFPAKVPAAIEALGKGISNFMFAPDEQLYRQLVDAFVSGVKDQLKRNPEVGAQNMAFAAYSRCVVEPRTASLDAVVNLTLDDIIDNGRLYFSNRAASVLYVGQHRQNFPQHSDIIKIVDEVVPVRTFATNARVLNKGVVRDPNNNIAPT